MSRFLWILIVVVGVISMSTFTRSATAQQSAVHVDASGSNIAAPSGTNSGSTWTGSTGAYKYLQNGLHRAATLLAANPSVPVEIRVRGASVGSGGMTYKPDEGNGLTAGTHTLSFELIKNVQINGQYIGGSGAGANDRDPSLLSILSGEIGTANDFSDNSYHVVSATDSAISILNCRLDGFTITRGNGEDLGGGGLFIDDASPRVQRCVITDNRTGDSKSPQDIEDEQETEGVTNSYGAGAQVSHSAAVFTRCTFTGNENNSGTVISGGGIVIQNGPVGSEEPFATRLINCTITGNQASSGGGVMVRASAIADVVNSLFVGNDAVTGTGNTTPWGGGIAVAFGAQLDVINCTFNANGASKGGAYALYRTEEDNFIKNCILWGDAAGTDSGDEIFIEGATDPVLTVSDSNVREKDVPQGVLAPGGTITYTGVQLGDNATTHNPLFVSSSDFRLQCGSPCINIITSGADASVPVDEFDLDVDLSTTERTPDLDIASRVIVKIDMGSFEKPMESTCFTDINQDGVVGVADLLAVISHWGACPALPSACVGDTQGPCLNQGNGEVNVQDLLAVISTWGTTCGGTPEDMPQTVQDCMNACAPLGIGTPEYTDCVEKCTSSLP